MRWKLSRTVLRGGPGGNTGPLLDTGKPGKKQPWHFHLPGEEPVETCTIVITAANEFSAKYHDRMPVIVDPGDYDRWLDLTTRTDRLLPLLDSRPVAGMEVVAVNPAVNNPRNQGPEPLTPAGGLPVDPG